MSDERWQTIIVVGDEFRGDPRGWLAGRAGTTMSWLLVHADDGVIWGRREPDGSLILSSDVFDWKLKYPVVAVELRAATVQQARVFGPGGELLLWRDDGGFAARLIVDGPRPPADAFEEKHLLWGMGRPLDVQQGFTLLQEGKQGPQHAPPVVVPAGMRPALVARHYLDYDAEGQAFVALSRLVNLVTVERSGP